MNREQLMKGADAKREAVKQLLELIEYFNRDGYSRYGYRGDQDGLTPVKTAIRAMREYHDLLQTKAGSDAQTAMLHQQLVDKGLVPA